LLNNIIGNFIYIILIIIIVSIYIAVDYIHHHIIYSVRK